MDPETSVRRPAAGGRGTAFSAPHAGAYAVFSLKLRYEGDRLAEAVLNGRRWIDTRIPLCYNQLAFLQKRKEENHETCKVSRTVPAGAGPCPCARRLRRAGKSDLPGTYKIDLDLAPALNSAMTQLGLAEEDLADLTLPVPYTLTLGEDGTYSMQADKEATVTALHTYLQGCGSAIEAALYKTAEESGLSREDFDAAFEQSTGSSVSDYVAEQISQLDEESLLSSLEEDEESGVYKAADGKLYFEEQEADFSEEDYVSYTLEGGKLTFTSVTGDAMDLQSLSEMLGDLFPMVFTKQ